MVGRLKGGISEGDDGYQERRSDGQLGITISIE